MEPELAEARNGEPATVGGGGSRGGEDAQGRGGVSSHVTSGAGATEEKQE
jgi:hypothetical protein